MVFTGIPVQWWHCFSSEIAVAIRGFVVLMVYCDATLTHQNISTKSLKANFFMIGMPNTDSHNQIRI